VFDTRHKMMPLQRILKLPASLAAFRSISLQQEAIFLNLKTRNISCTVTSNSSDDPDKRLPKIYTKTGDKGRSSLYTGERRAKDDRIFSALGAIDELSCQVGLARELGRSKSLDTGIIDQLERVQCLLQDIGSCVATPMSSARPAHLKRTGFNSQHTSELERWIDDYTSKLPPLENFILPGGGVVAATVHVARAVCRRAEREVTPLVSEEECEAEVGRYLNRLSDFLFTLARFIVIDEGGQETIYTRPSH